ncbi:hypothetical protein [Spiroplasma endosymbiont of Cantharis rufa]|uniref:hypothetical protein n=1 Tax=Spiroplasma endosymbiont of Cantharis rufa TaxID=3066279 RepID=UPI0030D56976
MNNYNKKNVKKLYMLFVLTHLTIIFTSTFFKYSNENLYIAIQIAWIINTVIISLICFWIVIESMVIIHRLKKSFIGFKTFKCFKRFTYLNEFFNLILITVPIFISTEYQAVEYFWDSNQTIINLEFFLIVSFTIIVSFTCVIISLNIVYEKIINKIKLKMNEQVFFNFSKIVKKESFFSEYSNITKSLLQKIYLEFETILERNYFVEEVVDCKKSSHLKTFKKGVTPPLNIF